MSGGAWRCYRESPTSWTAEIYAGERRISRPLVSPFRTFLPGRDLL
jgi:hypothetical protein